MLVLQKKDLPGVSQLTSEPKVASMCPIHSIILATTCTNMPPVSEWVKDSTASAESETNSTTTPDSRPQSEKPQAEVSSTDSSTSEASSSVQLASEERTTITLPVVSLCVPSPRTFTILEGYLYTKSGPDLLARLLPPLPIDFLDHVQKPTPDDITFAPEDEIPPHMIRTLEALGKRLRATFPVRVLLSHALNVHGVWMNVCALGIFDNNLWKILAVAWRVLMATLEDVGGSSAMSVLHAPQSSHVTESEAASPAEGEARPL